MSGDSSDRAVFRLSGPSDVADLLGVEPGLMNFLLHRLAPAQRYHEFEIARRTGGTRKIHAPIKPIKDMQRALAGILSEVYKPPAHVHGYVPDRSILTKAIVHSGQKWVLRVDIKEFFPSIHFGRVRGMFRSPPFSLPPNVTRLLAHLCCHDGVLPQGAPTSPVISNLICRGFDRELANLAREHRCYYTRYCDDLVFSTGKRSFPSALATTDTDSRRTVAGESLLAVVSASGFELNEEKSVLRPRTQRQMVTGLIVNKTPNVTQKYVRMLRHLLYVWDRYGATAAEAHLASVDLGNRPPGKRTPEFGLVVRGKIQHVGSVKGWNHPVYKRLALRLQELAPSFAPTERISDDPTRVEIFCEGKTDYVHFQSAIRYFHEKGEFEEIRLELNKNVTGGAAKLLQRCEMLSDMAQSDLTVCIFDRDERSTIRKADGESGPKAWGNGVYSVVTPIPDFRDGIESICIEMLFPDAVLAITDQAGRRIYLRSEFGDEGKHETEPVFCPEINMSRSSLIVKRAIDFESENNLALSKSAFAELIARGHNDHSEVTFEGFRRTFDFIVAARKNWLLQQ